MGELRPHKIVTGCLVFNGKEEFILVTEKDTKKLNLPSGGLEHETLSAGAERENKEEDGLRVKLDFIVGFYHNHNRKGKNVLKVIYAGHPVGGKLDNHMGAAYYSRWQLSKIPDRKLHDPLMIRWAVSDYFKGIEYPLEAIRECS